MGKRAYRHPAPEPFEGDIRAVTLGGTALWLVLFVVQLPFLGWLDDHDRMWWLWTCLAGAGLGVLGLWYVRRREAALARGGDAGAQSNT